MKSTKSKTPNLNKVSDVLGVGVGIAGLGSIILILLFPALLTFYTGWWGCQYSLDYVSSQRNGVTTSVGVGPKAICTAFSPTFLPQVAGVITSVLDTGTDVPTPKQVRGSN